MKTVRLFTIMIVAMLVFAMFPTAPVYAAAAGSTVAGSAVAAGTKTVNLTIINQTGGTLYVSLSGKLSYSFVVAKGKKSKFKIASGTYTVNASSSACPGSYSKKKNFQGGGTLGFVCTHH